MVSKKSGRYPWKHIDISNLGPLIKRLRDDGLSIDFIATAVGRSRDKVIDILSEVDNGVH